jgi:hypothetical protein
VDFSSQFLGFLGGLLAALFDQALLPVLSSACLRAVFCFSLLARSCSAATLACWRGRGFAARR